MTAMGSGHAFKTADPDEVGLDASQMKRARDALREQVESRTSPGLVAIVARRGEIVLAEPIVNAYLGCIPDLEIKKPPGVGMMYGNLGYEMLSEIVRLITGDSLGAAMRSRVFEPLGMHDSAMAPGTDLFSRLADQEPGMPPSDELLKAMTGVDRETPFTSDPASGGVVSSPTEYVRFGLMILAGGTLDGVRVLSKASVTAVTANQIPGAPDLLFGNKEASWGYGFSVLGRERWPYFGGGIVPAGTARHTGSGGIDHWFDFENQIAATCFELITEVSPMLEPITAVGLRFQDVTTTAVVD